MKFKELNVVEIGREEAYELCGGDLPTKKTRCIISRQVGLVSSVIYKEKTRYFIGDLVIDEEGI